MKLFISNAILRYENKKVKQDVEAYKAMILATQDDYISIRTERDIARLDCAVAESNHMNTLERFLEAQERIDELQAENISLRAERDAMAKSIRIVSEPIETIQPRGIIE